MTINLTIFAALYPMCVLDHAKTDLTACQSVCVRLVQNRRKQDLQYNWHCENNHAQLPLLWFHYPHGIVACPHRHHDASTQQLGEQTTQELLKLADNVACQVLLHCSMCFFLCVACPNNREKHQHIVQHSKTIFGTKNIA